MDQNRYLNPNMLFLIPALGSISIYISIAYFLEREESFFLLSGYLLLFLAYLSFIFNALTTKHVYWLLGLSVVIRLVFLFSVPNLSDDFYRFIWDGRLIINHVHPFAEPPQYYMDVNLGIPGITQSLFSKLNSQLYYTIYPPIYQVVFAISAFLFPHSVEGSVLVMRAFIIAAEVGTMYMMLKTLRQMCLPIKNILFYALNPLVIIELTGNLHFEAFLILFLILSFYFFNAGKLIPSALFLSMAICTKLIPLIFIPLLINRLSWKNSVGYLAIVVPTCFLMFLPLLSVEWLNGFSSSFLLYFHTFEFNASIYYIIRQLGYLIFGFNIIAVAGALLGLSIIGLILFFVKKEDITKIKIFESSMWVLLILTLLSTTLHPWYITPLLAVSVFTRYRFVVVWTFMIFLTYLNYSQEGFNESLWVVFWEYAIVLTFLYFEWKHYPVAQQLKHKIRLRFLHARD